MTSLRTHASPNPSTTERADAGAAHAPRAMRRRRRYAARLWGQDFFVVSHLGRFLTERIARSVRPGSRVADIGCGDQPLRAQVEELGGRYVGIDIVQNGAGTVDIVAPITHVPCEGESFDVILCTEVLEHVSETCAAVAELARLLVPGGALIVTTPFAYPLHEEPYDFVRLTPHQLRTVAADVGLQVDELELAGNEVEVWATVWDNLWSRLRPGRRGVLLRSATVASRVVVNACTLVCSALIGGYLPQRYFLSSLCVLRRPMGSS